MTNYNAMEYIKQAVCPRLKEGEIYTFRFLENAEGREKHVKKKRMRLLGCYPHIAHFKDSKGTKHSYQYPDVGKMLRGEVLNR